MAPPSSSAWSSRGIHLYRALRRAHQKHLPSREMRDLGNAYIRSEFKLHKDSSNATQMERFLNEWEQYLQHIGQTARARQVQQTTETSMKVSFGKDLPHHVELSPEQTAQLEKLRNETESAKGKGL